MRKRSRAPIRTKSRHTLHWLLIPLAVLALAGCRNRGGGEDDPTATPSSTPAASASLSPDSSPTPTDNATVAATPTPELPPFQAGTFERTITVDGTERDYRLYVPNTLSGAPAPLVVGLHGGFGSGAQFADTAHFDQQAREGGFIAAYPDGLGGFPTWNGGRCCGYASRNNVDDVAFIEAMIDDIAGDYALDTSRIYAAGHSNGAIMALRLACESGRFRAVAAVAGSLEIPSCHPSHPASILMIHGDADENHPLEGGRGDESVSQVDFTSVADSMDVLAPAMGCSLVTTEQVNGPLTTTNWNGCPNGVTLRLIVIAGASHAWPGGKKGIIFSAEPSQDLDATAATWNFFEELETQ